MGWASCLPCISLFIRRIESDRSFSRLTSDDCATNPVFSKNRVSLPEYRFPINVPHLGRVYFNCAFLSLLLVKPTP
ncbi:MAG TPA: hypothetical protein DDW76_23325 [Cyanobacteria bacterium UBA11369]|nr:hypothetical protein [Cyanobacteria bacterium UBA11368]HBE51624.1 hypothetical protein [Cyanobacteria bacterium UBA11369]